MAPSGELCSGLFALILRPHAADSRHPHFLFWCPPCANYVPYVTHQDGRGGPSKWFISVKPA